jgi:5'-3' exonuclease, N-terminal resolvase-like domain
MNVHLVDGTFELFRCFHGAPRASGPSGREVGAARGLLATLVSLVGEPEVTHVAVAFDSVVVPAGAAKDRSANGLIASQQALAAQVVRSLGIPVWPAGRYQADELLASAARMLAERQDVARVLICSSDNDFDQCVRGERVVVLDRIRKVVTDEAAVRSRWGVAPQQIADIPLDAQQWDVPVRGRDRLASSLRDHRAEALLCRDLAELRADLPVPAHPTVLEWHGAHHRLVAELVEALGDDSSVERITRWADA